MRIANGCQADADIAVDTTKPASSLVNRGEELTVPRSLAPQASAALVPYEGFFDGGTCTREGNSAAGAGALLWHIHSSGPPTCIARAILAIPGHSSASLAEPHACSLALQLLTILAREHWESHGSTLGARLVGDCIPVIRYASAQAHFGPLINVLPSITASDRPLKLGGTLHGKLSIGGTTPTHTLSHGLPPGGPTTSVYMGYVCVTPSSSGVVWCTPAIVMLCFLLGRNHPLVTCTPARSASAQMRPQPSVTGRTATCHASQWNNPIARCAVLLLLLRTPALGSSASRRKMHSFGRDKPGTSKPGCAIVSQKQLSSALSSNPWTRTMSEHWEETSSTNSHS